MQAVESSSDQASDVPAGKFFAQFKGFLGHADFGPQPVRAIALEVSVKPVDGGPLFAGSLRSGLGFRHGHRLGKAPKGNVEKLLCHLVADDSLPRGYRPSNQLGRPPSLRWHASVEGVNEDVRVEEEPTVHSSHSG